MSLLNEDIKGQLLVKAHVSPVLTYMRVDLPVRETAACRPSAS